MNFLLKPIMISLTLALKDLSILSSLSLAAAPTLSREFFEMMSSN